MNFGNVKRVELFYGRSRSVRPAFTKRGFGNLCYAFKNDGFCEKGDDCPFSHDVGTEEQPGDEAADNSTDAEEAHSGNGCVIFDTEEGMNVAMQQSSIYVSHKVVKLSPWMSTQDGRDTTTCYAWTKFNCTHGDDCKFAHEGDGACVKVGEPYKGRKFKCMSWTKKGKCSKGDFCNFLHDATSKGGKVELKGQGADAGVEQRKEADKDNKEGSYEDGEAKAPRGAVVTGICNNLRKKGRCRKGDKCPYSHDLAPITDAVPEKNTEREAGAVKRRKITGSFLVQAREKRENSVINFE
jgi:hypothetical protein